MPIWEAFCGYGFHIHPDFIPSAGAVNKSLYYMASSVSEQDKLNPAL